jgi:hypothetical protein
MKTKKPSHKQRILAWMKRGRTITFLQALNMFGCANMKGRAFDIKKDGHPIDKKWVTTDSGKRVASYYLKKAA